MPPEISLPRLPIARRSQLRRTISILAGLGLITFGFIGFKGDISPTAGWGMLILGRTISLIADVAIIGTILWLANTSVRSTSRSSSTPSGSLGDVIQAQSPFIVLMIVYSVFEAHKRWVGPASFWNQAILFAINTVGLVLIMSGADPDS